MMFTAHLQKSVMYLFFLLLVFLCSLPAHGSQPEQPKHPYAYIERPSVQTGIPASEFQLPINIVNVNKKVHVEVRLIRNRLYGSNDDLAEYHMEPMRFTTDKSTLIRVKIDPPYDGIFYIRSLIKIDETESHNNMYISKSENYIYYGGIINDMINRIVNFELRNEKTYREPAVQHEISRNIATESSQFHGGWQNPLDGNNASVNLHNQLRRKIQNKIEKQINSALYQINRSR
jgi:hypothetical protein